MGAMQRICGIASVVIFLVISSSQALPVEENSTELIDPEIARRMAYDAFMLMAPRQSRVACLNPFAISDENENFRANEMMDMALEYLRNMIREKNINRVDIPPFEEGFSKKIGLINVKGSFKGEQGWVESMLSIARKGNANVNLDGTSVMLESALGLNTLQLGMRYTAKLAFVKVSGSLEAKVRSNSVAFTGGMDYSTGECRLYLKDLKLTELGKIDVHVTGLGKLNWMYSKIVSWVTKQLHKKIHDTIENKMKEGMSKALEKVKCPFL